MLKLFLLILVNRVSRFHLYFSKNDKHNAKHYTTVFGHRNLIYIMSFVAIYIYICIYINAFDAIIMVEFVYFICAVLSSIRRYTTLAASLTCTSYVNATLRQTGELTQHTVVARDKRKSLVW